MEKIPFTYVLKVIERIRESFPEAVEIYTKGYCVQFAMILLEIFPNGKILYDLNHAIFELEGNVYDINGFAIKTENHSEIQKYGVLKMFDMMKNKIN